MSEIVWELPPSVPADPVSETAVDGGSDHPEEAVRRLPQQFRKPKIEKLLRIFCKPMAALEQAFVDLLTKRTVETAEGAQLEVLGRIVGQPLVDVAETTYRTLVRARIVANKSSGLGDQVLRIARAVTLDYATQAEVVAAGAMALKLTPYYPATFMIRVDGVDLPWDLADLLLASFLVRVAGTGIRPVLEFTAQDADGVYDLHDSSFVLSSTTDETAGDGEGLADDSGLGGDVGGYLNSVLM